MIANKINEFVIENLNGEYERDQPGKINLNINQCFKKAFYLYHNVEKKYKKETKILIAEKVFKAKEYDETIYHVFENKCSGKMEFKYNENFHNDNLKNIVGSIDSIVRIYDEKVLVKYFFPTNNMYTNLAKFKKIPGRFYRELQLLMYLFELQKTVVLYKANDLGAGMNEMIINYNDGIIDDLINKLYEKVRIVSSTEEPKVKFNGWDSVCMHCPFAYKCREKYSKPKNKYN